jgi:hypothetical protein
MDKQTQKAIEILNIQKSKLDSGKSLNDGIWRIQLLSYIATYFSENSTEYKFLSKKHFYVDEYDSRAYRISENSIQDDLKEKIVQAREFIDNCIETLKNTGIYRKPKSNFLSRVSENWLIFICGIIISVLVGIFYIGYWYGQHSSLTPPFVTNQKAEKPANITNDTTKYKKVK